MRVYGLISIRVYCFLPCSSSSFSLSIGGHSSQGNFWSMFDAGCLPVDSDFELQDPEAPLRLSVKGQPSQNQYNVFVYGSLLPGLHNHWLISNAEFLGYHKTQPNFDMFSLGQFPAVCGGGHTAISGALYRVTRGTRDKLDLLEQHPHLVSSRTSGASDQQAHARLDVPHVARGARDQGKLGQVSPFRRLVYLLHSKTGQRAWSSFESKIRASRFEF